MKKYIKVIFIVLVIIFISIGMFYKYKNYMYAKKAAEIKKQELQAQSIIKDSAPTLEVGDSQTLNLATKSKNKTNKDFKWSSSDPSIVIVDENGVVNALKSGKTIITATSSDGNKETYTINVEDVNPQEINFSVATEYNADLFGTKVIITLVGVEPSNLDKYIVKYDGNETRLHSATNTFRLFIDGNVDTSTARTKISVSLK